MVGSKRHLAVLLTGGVIAFLGVATRSAQAQFLLSPGGTSGGASSTPSSANYSSVYQEGGDTSDYLIPASAPTTNGNPTYTDALGAGVFTSTANVGGEGTAPTLGFLYTNGSNTNVPATYATVVYNTVTPAGTTANPLSLGTTSPSVSTFNTPTTPTSAPITLTADFVAPNYAIEYIGFIFPKDTDAGASVTATTAGDYVGAELALSTSGTNSSFKIYGDENFAGTGSVALSSQGTIATASSHAFRLSLTLVNTSSSHDLLTATVSALAAGTTTGSPVTVTYATANGNSAGDFHVASSLAIEVGQGPLATTEDDVNNITLSTPEPGSCGIILVSTAVTLLRRKKKIQHADAF